MPSSRESAGLGTIEWQVIEQPMGTTLYAGRRVLQKGDIDVFPASDGIRRGPKPRSWTVGAAVHWLFDFHLKQICLGGGFLLHLLSRPASEPRNLGVAFRAQRSPAGHTQSFEFFALGNGDRAHQPGNGELRIELFQGPMGWEVGFTEFLTDVDVRLRRDKPGFLRNLISSGSDVLWTVRILRGSAIHWPVVSDDISPQPPN